MMTRSRLMLLLILSLVVSLMPGSSQVPTSQANMQAIVTYRLVEAFYQDRQVYYYTFNNGSPVVDDGAAVGVGVQYRLVDVDGEPIEGQYDILSANIGDEGYSDLREIVEVSVPEDYEANSITNAADLLAEDWPQNATGINRNIPVVRLHSQLQARDHQPMSVWFDDEELSAYDFGEMTEKSAPIYILIEGFDPDGNPVRINHPALVDVMHDDEGYSDFWQVVFVTVPNTVEPNEFRNVQALFDAEFPMTASANVVNCPALRLEYLQVAFYDDAAYNIYYAPVPETLELPAELPLIYSHIDELGEEQPFVMTVNEYDEEYSGYCQNATVIGEPVMRTNASDLLAGDSMEVVPDDAITTCAYLSLYIQPIEE